MYPKWIALQRLILPGGRNGCVYRHERGIQSKSSKRLMALGSLPGRLIQFLTLWNGRAYRLESDTPSKSSKRLMALESVFQLFKFLMNWLRLLGLYSEFSVK